jgi:hypothetical protein
MPISVISGEELFSIVNKELGIRANPDSRLHVLALLWEVTASSGVNGNIRETRTDVVKVLDSTKTSLNEDESQVFKYFQVAHIGYIAEEEINNCVNLPDRVTRLLEDILWDRRHSMTINGAYVGKRKAAPKDGEFPYSEPLYLDLHE